MLHYWFRRNTALYIYQILNFYLIIISEYETLTTTKHIEKSVYLDFNIEARLLETDDKMEEQLSQISEAIFNHNKERGKNPYMSALVLPISLGNILKSILYFLQMRKLPVI